MHLESVITPLLVPDIPVYLWLAGAHEFDEAFGQDAVRISQRVILDTDAYASARYAITTLNKAME